MKPVLAISLAWLLFAGSHLWLSSSTMRDQLISRLGKVGFTLFYSGMASIGLVILTIVTIHFGDQGAAGLELAKYTIVSALLGVIAFLGAMLMIAGLIGYPGSAIASLARRSRQTDKTDQSLLSVSPLEKTTRHPFFVGLILLTGAHVLLASTLAQAIYFFGYVFLAGYGMVLQDRKLTRQHGQFYQSYIEATSVIPFMSRNSGKTLSAKPNNLKLVIAIGAAVILFLAHPIWRWGNGSLFAILILSGGLYAVAKQLATAKKRGDSC